MKIRVQAGATIIRSEGNVRQTLDTIKLIGPHETDAKRWDDGEGGYVYEFTYLREQWTADGTDVTEL
jgi:hypothetical protein